MAERIDITLREVGGPDDGKRIQKLKQALDQLIPSSVDAAHKWIKGKFFDVHKVRI